MHASKKPRDTPFSFNTQRGCWHCFSCEENGNVVSLARALGIIEAHTSNSLDALEAIRAAAAATASFGRATATTLKVLFAHITRATASQSLSYRANSRDIANTANVGLGTAGRAHWRLRAGGWLILHPCDCGNPGCHARGTGFKHSQRASRFTLRLPPHLTRQSGTALRSKAGPESTPCSTLTRSHDAFRFGALGPNGERVYRALETGGVWKSAPQLAAAVPGRISPATVRRALVKLKSVNLAVHDGAGWRLGTGSLDDAARHFGTAGDGERQRERYDNDRITYRRALVNDGVTTAEKPTLQYVLSEVAHPEVMDRAVEWLQRRALCGQPDTPFDALDALTQARIRMLTGTAPAPAPNWRHPVFHRRSDRGMHAQRRTRPTTRTQTQREEHRG